MRNFRPLRRRLRGGNESRDPVQHQLRECQEPGIDVQFEDEVAHAAAALYGAEAWELGTGPRSGRTFEPAAMHGSPTSRYFIGTPMLAIVSPLVIDGTARMKRTTPLSGAWASMRTRPR